MESFAPNAYTYFARLHLFSPARRRHARHASKQTRRSFFERHYPRALWSTVKLDIRPISRVHLSPPGRFAMSPAMNPRTLWTLGLVGLLVLLLAVINFVNLMTARAAQRAIEVGVRKSAGRASHRPDRAVPRRGLSVCVCRRIPGHGDGRTRAADLQRHAEHRSTTTVSGGHRVPSSTGANRRWRSPCCSLRSC